ncbi:GSCFA domain-containing protein [Massilia sp. TS11]|uniref:GSCFA domain-containing protein n=1 Tax=Massilia sp. TS11 TaxID=2908003 RepID=UPI001EDA9B06|nr:GSCFA domain-containing protein [Massilia sp. TS11]MCG2582833.1 GSCFA domain-containing protein [Massilia sp. TS11]
MKKLFHKVRSVNPGVQFILNVSPVPLVAIYEQRHVLTSTTVSKAILRVAADEVANGREGVIYFPSNEIITSPASGDRYDADDLRQVTDVEVAHVMRLFTKHFLNGPTTQSVPSTMPVFAPSAAQEEKIVCEEEEIERAVRQASF